MGYIFRYSSQQKVFFSQNGGNSWTNISSNLPTYQSTVFFITHPTKPYLLEQMLVFYKDSTTLNGQHLIKDFQMLSSPNSYHINSNTLFAGTYGRGLWMTSLPATVPPTSSFSYSVVNECAGLVSFSRSSANAVSLEWDFGDNSSSNESTTTHQFSSSGSIMFAWWQSTN